MLVSAGIVALVVVPEHKPDPAVSSGANRCLGHSLVLPHGFSHGLYASLGVTTCALLVVGTAVLLMGLVGHSRRRRTGGTIVGTPRSSV
jgi:hypothetical protein